MSINVEQIKALFRSKSPPEPDFWLEMDSNNYIPVYVIEDFSEVWVFTDELEVGDL